MPPSSQPLTLPELLGQTLACTCGVEHTVPTREIILGAGALQHIAACCDRHLPGQRVVLVADATTHRIAGAQVADLLSAAGYDLEVLRLPAAPESRVSADDTTIDAVRTAIHPEVDGLIAVGAGTINDVTKLASFQLGKPYIVCPTAPSMNGYTSTIAAILSKGIKRTVPARPPVAVVADLDILATAPMLMMRAGLGDLLSKPVSTADWKLGQLVNGGYYCELPLRLVAHAERTCWGSVEALGCGAPAGVAALTEALLLSGISMVVAGSSSPASGGEHLLSHYWDMTAHWYGRQEHLHGAQVGVATLVTATLYEKLRQIEPRHIDVTMLQQQYPDWASLAQTLRQVHGPLGEEVVAEAQKKYLPVAQKALEWRQMVEQWDVLWEALTPILVPAAHIRELLLAAGAPTTIRELGISPAELRVAYLHARDIRGRYTVLDFAHDLGVLEALCDEVLTASRVLD